MRLSIGLIYRGLSVIYIHIFLKYYIKKYGCEEIINKDAIRMVEFYKMKSNYFVKERLFLRKGCCLEMLLIFDLSINVGCYVGFINHILIL